MIPKDETIHRELLLDNSITLDEFDLIYNLFSSLKISQASKF